MPPRDTAGEPPFDRSPRVSFAFPQSLLSAGGGVPGRGKRVRVCGLDTMPPGRRRGGNRVKNLEQLKPGDLVLAKVKGYPAWPAKVSSIYVLFFPLVLYVNWAFDASVIRRLPISVLHLLGLFGTGNPGFWILVILLCVSWFSGAVLIGVFLRTLCFISC